MLVLSRAHKCLTKEGSSVVKKFLPKLWELTKYASNGYYQLDAFLDIL